MGFGNDILKWLGFGRYRSSPTPVADGNIVDLLTDSIGRLKVVLDESTGAPSTSVFRPVGDVIDLSWTASPPVLQGKVGTYASLASKTISIKIGSGSPIVVTLDSSTTATGHRDKINGTSGLSGVCSVKATVSGSVLQLSHASGVSVVAMSDEPTVFASLGLPFGEAAAGETSSVNIPLVFDATRSDLWCAPVDVPDGANCATLLLDHTNYVIGSFGDELMGFEWTWNALYAVDDEAPTLANARSFAVEDPIAAVTDPGANAVINTIRQRKALLRWLGSIPAADWSTPGVDRRDLPISLPPGARRLILAPTRMAAETDTPALALPIALRRLSGRIAFGAM